MKNFTKESLIPSTSRIWRKLGGALLGLAVLIAFGTSASAQAIQSEDFQAGGTGTWSSGQFGNSTTAPCEATRSIRYNLWGSAPIAQLLSPVLTSNGLLTTMSFDYKVVDYGSLAPTSAANFTGFVQYASTPSGPWTTVYTIDATTHTPSATCATPSFIFTPPVGNLYVRFDCIRNGGDFYIYLDDIDILQATPTCSGAPNVPTAAISGTSGCDGSALDLTATGLDAGTGLSQQWEYSSDNFAADINDLIGETSATASILSPASTVYYRIRHECNDLPSIVYSNVVSYAGVSCATDVVPYAGNDANPCGNNIVFTDHAGATTNYNSGANGYLVLENTAGSFIDLTGTYDTETNWDNVYIFDGIGTGGTLLQTLTGSGTITPIAGTDGQILTVAFVSDGSGTEPGFEFEAIYSGTCLLCSGAPAVSAATIDRDAGCAVAASVLTATGVGTVNTSYQWQVSNDNFVADINDIVGATNATANVTTPPGAGVTYYRLLSTCDDDGATSFSNTVTYTSQLCGAVDVPGSGSNTISCGTSTWLYDDVGGATPYSNNVDGYTVIDASGGAIPSLYGYYDVETTWDEVNVYEGAGTTGTLLGSFDGTGLIDITGTAGTPLTVQLVTDASGTYPGFALQVLYDEVTTGPCASCTAPPAAGTVSIPSTGGCAGNTMTLTSAGLDVTADNSYQWQVSNDDFVLDINDIVGETGATYDLTTVDGTFYYRIQSFCSADLGQPSYSPSVSYAGFTCAQESTPVSGNNSIVCGTTTQVTDDGGLAGNYSSGADGYTVFESSLTATIAFSGDYDMESGWDYLRIYEGVGTGGTLAYSYTGSGSITPFTSLPGQSITIQCDTDAGGTEAGFAILGIYSGTCDPCAAAPTVTATTSVTGNSATINWTAAASVPGVGYEWEVRTSGAGGSGAVGLVATGTTNNSTLDAALGAVLSPNTDYYVYARSECNAATDYSGWNTGGGDFTTPCIAETAPTVAEDFSTYAGNAPDPACWSESTAAIPTTPSAIATGNGSWSNTTGFGNTGSDPGVKANLWSSSSSTFWLISQPIDLGATGGVYRVN
ncbi:hypothetical protein OAL15_03960, partial [Flavobacteriales bacterium]|nr:hypothetical protein [Flavobacteriales bacterium]